MRFLIFIFLFLLASVSSHAQKFLDSSINGEFETEYIDGDHWIYRSIDGIRVGICNRFFDEGYGKFYQIGILVDNNTTESFVFDPENVSADLITNKGKSKQLNVFTSEEFQKKLKSKHDLELALYGFSAGLNGASASDYMNLNNMQSNMTQQRNSLKQNYLKKNTVHPGTSIIGYMNIQHKKGQQLNLCIVVNGTKFTYAWDISSKFDPHPTEDPIYLND